jgi:hypothetical protein
MRSILASLLAASLLIGCNREQNLGPPRTVVTRTTTTSTTVPPAADSPIGALISFLQTKGFVGEYVAIPTNSVIGAGAGGSFKGKGFAVTFYHFADPNLASSVAAAGINGRQCYANGPLLMEVAMADEAFVQAFLSYQ